MSAFLFIFSLATPSCNQAVKNNRKCWKINEAKATTNKSPAFGQFWWKLKKKRINKDTTVSSFVIYGFKIFRNTLGLLYLKFAEQIIIMLKPHLASSYLFHHIINLVHDKYKTRIPVSVKTFESQVVKLELMSTNEAHILKRLQADWHNRTQFFAHLLISVHS